MANSSSIATEQRNWLAITDNDKIIRVDITYTADDTDGSIPDVTTLSYGGLIVGATHAPGATPATTLMDVVAEDVNGVDMLCGAGVNIVTTADMMRVPYPDGAVYTAFPVVGSLTVKMSGNSVNDAVGVFSIFIAR